MKLVTRAQLGWPASAAPSQSSTKGVKVHYEGTAVSTKLLTDHDACLDEWKNIRRSHLANTAENYSDVAYNYAACPHGYLLEGRGLRRRTGANGNQALNTAHFAILGLVGSSGLTEPTDAMLAAIRDGIDLLRNNGAGNEIKGHRDGYATACPGGPLYAWVKKGAPRPAASKPTTPTTPPKETTVSLTSAQNALLKKISGDLEKVKSRQALDGWGYRNAAADEASKEAGERIPDAYGYLVQTHETVTTLVTAVAELTAAVAALTKES
ncbi:peptidoglycan recognition family protein [Streptomyces sp. NPDC045714]|uniref:peptidoglycan recognition protein family protein n=1 Tax=Streptomyces sp. NPDC045714 TaxID=3154913 RepID=UPI0033F6BD40